jgi:hypothetical protein
MHAMERGRPMTRMRIDVRDKPSHRAVDWQRQYTWKASTMIDDRDEVAQAEIENALLGLLRGEDAEEFTLALTCRDGHFAIYFTDLKVAKVRVLGTGSRFAEAWNKRTALWQ